MKNARGEFGATATISVMKQEGTVALPTEPLEVVPPAKPQTPELDLSDDDDDQSIFKNA